MNITLQVGTHPHLTPGELEAFVEYCKRRKTTPDQEVARMILADLTAPPKARKRKAIPA